MSMKKTVLTFGLISGVVSSAMMLLTVPFIEWIGFDRGMIVGYTAIVLSLLLTFFGVRSYREQAGGRLTFARGFAVGILITLISCAFYVLTWEAIYFSGLVPDFMDKYAAHVIEGMKTNGASQQEIDATVTRMAHFREMYQNPLVNAAFTFMEPFPVGLGVTLISAAVLRRKA
jgi:hypothetical protein